MRRSPRRCGGDGPPAARDRPVPARPARRAARRCRGGPRGAASPARPRGATTPPPGGASRSRAPVRTLDGPRDGGQQVLDPLAQTGLASRRDRDLVGSALDLGLRAAVGQDFHRAEHEPWRRLRRQTPPQLLGGVALGQLEFHHFLDSLNPDRQGQGERHPRFRMKPLTEPQRQPGTVEEPLQTPHQVAVPDQPQVSLLGKTNAYS